MTIVVLLILAVVWAIVLIPPALRARSEGRPADSISSFRRQLTTLQRTGPRTWGRPAPLSSPTSRMQAALGGPTTVTPSHRPSSHPTRRPTSARTQKRRRDIFVGLLAAALISLALGAIPALRVLWIVHLLADVLFAGYIALLVRMRNSVAEREMNLRFLPGHAPQVEPLLLRRSAS